MKLTKLVLLASASLLLTGCNANNKDGGLSSDSQSSQSGGDVTIESINAGDYYFAEGFTPSSEEMASYVAMMTRPSVRFLEDSKFEVQIIMSMGSKAKYLWYGTYSYANKKLTTTVEGCRMSGSEQPGAGFVVTLSAKGSGIKFDFGTDSGGTLVNYGSSQLEKASGDIYSIGEYHYSGLENDEALSEEQRAHALKLFSKGEVHFVEDDIWFTAWAMDMIYVYKGVLPSPSSTYFSVTSVETHDYDGFLLSSQSGSLGNYSFSTPDANTFKLLHPSAGCTIVYSK